jgi:hypothetical protein
LRQRQGQQHGQQGDSASHGIPSLCVIHVLAERAGVGVAAPRPVGSSPAESRPTLADAISRRRMETAQVAPKGQPASRR